MNRIEWLKLSAEEQEEILEDLKENWPSFKNNHPRAKGYGRWHDMNLNDFVAAMNMPLYLSWLDYQNEYNRLRREERQKSMEGFLEYYSKKQPLAAKMIEDIYASKRDYQTVRKMARMVLDFFPPGNWPIRRGEEE